MPYRLAPCDLENPGWGDPWFPHGTFVASLAFWYGLVILLFFPLFLLPYHVETIQCYHRLHKLAHELAHITAWFCGFVSCCYFLFVLCWWVCFWLVFGFVWLWLHDGLLACISSLLMASQSADDYVYALINPCSPICNMQLNVLNDLAEAMKALEGKKAVSLANLLWLFLLGSCPFRCLLCCPCDGETQIWLGDLRLALWLWYFVFGRHDLPIRIRPPVSMLKFSR